MDKKRYQKVTYYCQSCNQPFEAEQGSRRSLCPDCLVKRVTGGKTKKAPSTPEQE